MASSDNSGYKIWGIDNVVYGPVELPALIDWVQEERVLADTWVYSEAKDFWSKASQIGELQMFFKEGRINRKTPSYDTTLIARSANIRPGSLRRIKIFSGMNDEQLSRFVEYLEVQNFRQWAEVVRQGEPGDAMYFVLEGEVRVRLMIGGKESILTILGAGDFFGEISLFDHGPRSADVLTNQDSIMLRVSASAFQKICDTAPDIATPFLRAIGQTLTSRIRADNKRFRDSVAIARTVPR